MCRLLARLRRNERGNVLAIVGAALVPLTIMIGSGIDLSRAYMAKAKMQSACDAASLAARRVMKDDQLTEAVRATGLEFFFFNYPQGLYGASRFNPAVSKPEAGVIRIAADAKIPTVVMQMFGFSTLPVAVSCDASLNFVNTDIVLVLDVTGSMNEAVDGTRKIEALQDAVMALYDELAPIQAQLASQGLRLRYGVVPYSSTVNVGRLLYADDPANLRANV
ncbi:MAG: pilus assembly protein TadG-related protein, partial [Pseudomonadota bacterium]|nr:pilus assembly protein TadG-related protein [Pseudomonadota bacterium]